MLIWLSVSVWGLPDASSQTSLSYGFLLPAPLQPVDAGQQARPVGVHAFAELGAQAVGD